MRVLDEEVEDGVTEGGIADGLMPVFAGELAGPAWFWPVSSLRETRADPGFDLAKRSRSQSSLSPYSPTGFLSPFYGHLSKFQVYWHDLNPRP